MMTPKTPPTHARGARQLATLPGPGVARIRRMMINAGRYRQHAAGVAARIAYRRWWRAVRLWARRAGTAPYHPAMYYYATTTALPPARIWAAGCPPK